jgi:hypothetical protein
MRKTIAALAALVLVSVLVCGREAGRVLPAHGDVPNYLAAAYHLHHDRIYSMQGPGAEVMPSLGREPGYPLLLAGLMFVDPAFGGMTLGCLDSDNACPARTYRLASLVNFLLIQLSGIGMFLLGRLVTGRSLGGLVAAGYLLLNLHLNKGWADLMSDRLAVGLLTLGMLLLAWSWGAARVWRWSATGLAFAALTLTKALFLPFCVLAWSASLVIALWRPGGRRQAALAATAAAVVYMAAVGGWAWRNEAVSGQFRLTDSRSGIALSTREVFDAMTPAQYAASFVYWTRGFGPGLARHLFGTEVVAPFDLDRPGGFYDTGQNGYGRQVHAIMLGQHVDYWQASRQVDAGILARIRSHWLAYGLTTLPLFYRGLWGDEFIVLGLPCLVWAAWAAVRRRNGMLLLLLGTGVFNLVAYAALSLNIPRYQMTSMPAIALAVGLAACRLAIGARLRRLPRALWTRRPGSPGTA